jgi:hypothetical protein
MIEQLEIDRKLIGVIASICLLFTVIWLALFIYTLAARGPVETMEQALASVANLDLLYSLTYANAALVTLTATMLFAGLYVHCRPQASTWSAIGLVFVPIYAVLNLVAYLSQITIVPRLVTLRAASDPLLAQLVQVWPGSAVNVLNSLGYAVLGMPSLIFGLLLFRGSRLMRLPADLLSLSGAASIVGLVGIILQSELLGLGSIVGGVLFLLALIPLSVNLLRESPRGRHPTGAVASQAAGGGR